MRAIYVNHCYFPILAFTISTISPRIMQYTTGADTSLYSFNSHKHHFLIFYKRQRRSIAHSKLVQWLDRLCILGAAKRAEPERMDHLQNVPRRLVPFNGVWQDETTIKHLVSNILMIGKHVLIILKLETNMTMTNNETMPAAHQVEHNIIDLHKLHVKAR